MNIEKQATHTPGPWHISGTHPRNIHIGAMSSPMVLASMNDCHAHTPANARLIAAAPEMAELLSIVRVLVSAPTNRFGKPEFYSAEEVAAREQLRLLAVKYDVAAAETVLHQAGQVIGAALAKAGVT